MKIFEAHRGSILHGTSFSGSDIDTIIVSIDKPLFYLSTQSLHSPRKRSVSSINGEDDVEVHEFLKFIYMLKKGNPNTVDYLFNEKWVYKSEIWDEVIDNRGLFFSRKILSSSYGMAISDFKSGVGENFKSKKAAKRAYSCYMTTKKATEFALSGSITVNDREDIELLIKIKQGKLENTKDILEGSISKLEKLLDSSDTFLPREPDHDKIDLLTSRLLAGALFGGNDG